MGFFDEFDNEGSGFDELDAIISNPDIGMEARNLAAQLVNTEAKARSVGLDPELAAPRKNLFMEGLDYLDALGQGVRGVVDTALRGDMFEGDVGTGFRRGQQEDVAFSDILRRQGVENPIVRGVVGLAGDIALDPLNWLTLGTGAVAKVGGKALGEVGQALAKEGVEKLSQFGITNAVDQSQHLDDVFKAIDRYKRSEKVFKSTDSASVRALEAKRMADAQDIFNNLYTTEQVLGDGIFAKKALKLGMDVPFLGHLFGADKNVAKEALLGDVGPVGKALRLAGKVWKPGKLKVADIELSDEMVEAFDNVRLFTNEQLGKVGSALGSLKDVPVLGMGVKAGEEIGKRGKAVFDAAADTFKKIFYQKALVGADANTNRLNFLDVKAGNKAKAYEKVAQTLGLENLRDKALMKEIYLTVDGLATSAIGKIDNDTELLNTINRIRKTGNVLDGDQLAFRRIADKTDEMGATVEQKFRAGLQNYLADPGVPPLNKELVQKVIGSMDDLALEEADKGLRHSFLEYYLPHKYTKIGEQEGKIFKSAGEGFLKERSYKTISDAFESKGYVGDTYLPDLLRYRWENGLNAISKRQYAQRLMLEEGLPEDLLQKVYREALQNPGGAAAKALKSYRVAFNPLDTSLLQEGAFNKAYQEAIGKIANGDLEASRLIANNAAEISQKLKEEMIAAGSKPLDNMLPDAFLGEIGEKIDLPGMEGKVLPKPIADSYRETVAAKDLLKDKLGQGRFGKATIEALDHASSFFKKFVTLPWPGYWAQNFLGDRFNQAMAGAHAMDPGIFARANSLLEGKSAIVNRNGMTLDRPTIERVIKDMGLNFSVNDFLGTVESFGKMNIDKMIAKEKNSLAKNLLSTESGTKAAALSQVHDKFQKGFDGFFRVSQVVHRFEKGDSLSDAVRSAQQLYFNYRDLSPVEQSLFRRFYMFYGYMSKATKQTMTNLVSNPGNITMQLHGVNALAEFFSDPKAAPTAEDFDMRLLNSAVNNEQLSRVIGKSEDGNPIFARGFAAPLNAVMQQFSAQAPRNLSVGELMSAGMDSAHRTIQKQFATSNPAINAAAQFVTGKNLYFDKPLNAEFLRKLPDLTAAAEQLAHFSHSEIPVTINDTVKDFLKAVPDGKGRLIADQSRMWILTNLIPGMSRLVSTAGTFANAEIPTPLAALRAGTGINITDSDVSRTYLYDRKTKLDKFMADNSVRQRIKNLAEDDEE